MKLEELDAKIKQRRLVNFKVSIRPGGKYHVSNGVETFVSSDLNYAVTQALGDTSIKINDNIYHIGDNQGIVLRQNGTLAADFLDGEWIWINPKLDIPEEDLEQLKPYCLAAEADKVR